MENLNLPPFVKGDKVVCTTNNVDDVENTNSGTIVKNTYIVSCVMWYGVTQFDWWMKVNGIDRWVKCKRFRKVQESKFRSVTFEKIMEETENICVN